MVISHARLPRPDSFASLARLHGADVAALARQAHALGRALGQPDGAARLSEAHLGAFGDAVGRCLERPEVPLRLRHLVARVLAGLQLGDAAKAQQGPMAARLEAAIGGADGRLLARLGARPATQTSAPLLDFVQRHSPDHAARERAAQMLAGTPGGSPTPSSWASGTPTSATSRDVGGSGSDDSMAQAMPASPRPRTPMRRTATPTTPPSPPPQAAAAAWLAAIPLAAKPPERKRPSLDEGRAQRAALARQPEVAAALPLPERLARTLRFSTLATPDGDYALSNTWLQGTYGKVRVGLDPQGVPVAVKEVLLAAGAGAGAAGVPPSPTALAAAGRKPQRPEAVPAAALRAELGWGQVADAAAGGEPFYRHGDKVYVVQALAAGSFYDVAISGDAALIGDLEVSARLLLEVGGALHACHTAQQDGQARGFVHQDVKLENILVRRDGSFWLADFGGAAPLAPRPGESGPGGAGTLPYISPEALEGRRVGATADTWSLGITVLAQVTGRNLVAELAPQPLTLGAMKVAHQRWQAWHAALERRPDGTIDPVAFGRAAGRGEPLHVALVELFEIAPQLAELLVNRMLQPLAFARPPAGTVASLVAAWPQMAAAQAQVRQRVVRQLEAEVLPEQDAILAGLRAYREDPASGLPAAVAAATAATAGPGAAAAPAPAPAPAPAAPAPAPADGLEALMARLPGLKI